MTTGFGNVPFTDADLIREVEREIALREVEYPTLVALGDVPRAWADLHLALMRAIRARLSGKGGRLT